MDINPIRLLDFAKVASDRFLKESVSLDNAIAEIADKHELNPLQIQRVAEDANHQVQAALYKGAEDKTFTFPLADAKNITQIVRGKEMPKVAFARVFDASRARSYASDKAAVLEKAASFRNREDGPRNTRDAKLTLEKVAQQMSKFREELLVRRVDAHGAIEESLAKVAQAAKDHIVQNDGKLSDFFKYACLRDPEFAVGYKVIFDGIRQDLMKLGSPIEQKLIADELEMPGSTVEVINGAHTLAIDLDTLKNKISEDDKLAWRIRLLDTFGEAVVDRIRSLRTSEEIDQSILDDVWKLGKQAEAGTDAFCDSLEKDGMVGKLLLALLGLGAIGAGGKVIEETSKGAVKGALGKRDEREQAQVLSGAKGEAY
jgi:hypothetical protein